MSASVRIVGGSLKGVLPDIRNGFGWADIPNSSFRKSSRNFLIAGPRLRMLWTSRFMSTSRSEKRRGFNTVGTLE